MAGNTNYLTARTIANKIARDYKDTTFELGDVMEWCAEAEKKIGQFEAFVRIKASGTVVNKKFKLPCDVYRILSVYNGKCKVDYQNDGCYLNVQDDDYILTLTYLGFPTDPDGFPIIKKGHEDACYWYCMQKLLFPDFMVGRIDINRWQYIQQEWGKQWQKARANYRDMSRNDMDEIAMIVCNIIPHVKLAKDLEYTKES
jgi:hypothetical protein